LLSIPFFFVYFSAGYAGYWSQGIVAWIVCYLILPAMRALQRLVIHWAIVLELFVASNADNRSHFAPPLLFWRGCRESNPPAFACIGDFGPTVVVWSAYLPFSSSQLCFDGGDLSPCIPPRDKPFSMIHQSQLKRSCPP